MGGAPSRFKTGDQVIIGVKDLDVISQMQRPYGGLRSGVLECVVRPSRIVSEKAEYAIVRTDSGNTYKIHLDLLRIFDGQADPQQNLPTLFDVVSHLKENLLFLAIYFGDVNNVRKLIKEVGPNTVIEGVHPLILASHKGHREIVRLLLENKANINATDSDGDTALHVAVKTNKLDVCTILVEKDADINIQNNGKYTPIMIAAAVGHEAILKYLVGRTEAKLNLGNSKNETALFLAVRNSQIASVETLLCCGADAKVLDGNGLTAFHLAALQGKEKIMEMFLEKRAMALVDSRILNDFAAMHMAILGDSQDCLRLLIKYKADKNVCTDDRYTPLHLAAMLNRLDCIKILAESEAELNSKDKDGNTPLHLAVFVFTVEDMNILSELLCAVELELKLDFDTEKLERTATYLVEAGALLTIKNNDGETPADLCLNQNLKAVLESLQCQRQQEEQRCKEMEIQELQKKVNQMKDQDNCKRCKNMPARITFNCGHKSCCLCSQKLSNCYNCGANIEMKIKMKY